MATTTTPTASKTKKRRSSSSSSCLLLLLLCSIFCWLVRGAKSWSLPPPLTAISPRRTTKTTTSSSSKTTKAATLISGGALSSSSLSSTTASSTTNRLLATPTACHATTSPITEEELDATSVVEIPGDDEGVDTPSSTILKKDTSTSTTVVLSDSHEFIKPDRDLRDYRVIRLPNNLIALLVSDNLDADEVGVEAASVHVQAGHMDDPPMLAGLSHFNEHMLFLGTTKYPDEDDYESFLSQFGGSSNAYTDMEDTNYYFSITTSAASNRSSTTEALRGGLDRLAQFFISPLFDENAVERELNAIDSEYRNGKTSDAWRIYQLLKATCHPDHPFAKFGCGNYQTLSSLGKEELLKALHKFWATYYRAFNLRLAVVGHGSLDELQKVVEETFGQLKYSSGAPRRIKNSEDNKSSSSSSSSSSLFTREHAVYGGIPAFGPDQVGRMRHVIPIAEMRTLKLYFPTPPLDDPALQATKPYRTLSHLLGHESPGSLHSLLNQEGWITSLSSGVGIDTSDFSLFSISLSLTPRGMQNKNQILDLVFSWIALIREKYYSEDSSIMEAYHEELRKISAMNFRFRENGDPTDFCSSASELLFDMMDEHQYNGGKDDSNPYARLLLGGSETSEYDPVIARAFLDRLRPQNCMISVLNSDHRENITNGEAGGEWLTEPLYGARYRVELISDEQMKAWESPSSDSRLKLPSLNDYIPSDFSLRADDGKQLVDESSDPFEPPKILVNRPNLRMWHKMDRYWRVPKAFIRLAILSSKSYQTPRTMTLTRIFQRVLNDDLNSFVYDASIAGCSYRVSCTPYGYRISVRGYSEKLPFLLDVLTTRILSLIQEMKQLGEGSNNNTPSPLLEKFEKARESLLRETKNYRLDPPHEVANYNSRVFIEDNVWYLDNYIDELEGGSSDGREQNYNVDGESTKMLLEDPRTMMAECAQVAEECFMGRVKCEALCMGNIDEAGAQQVVSVIDRHFLGPSSRPLSEVETPRFRSLKLPTREEASRIFGGKIERKIPMVYQDIALSASEENNAVEIIIQAGCELDLGYEGMAILDLITYMAHNSAFNQLRTKEQLGYLVSAFARKTAGSAWGLSIVVQSSKALPCVLEERCEAWLETFRQELEDMPAEEMAKEASAVVAQLLEKETKLSQEVSRAWGEILNTEGLSDRMRTPSFDRLDRLARELTLVDSDDDSSESGLKTPNELKKLVLSFFDEHFSVHSPTRRAMSTRVYNHNSKSHYDASIGEPGVLSSYSDMRHYKQFLSSWPCTPYWRVIDGNAQSAKR